MFSTFVNHFIRETYRTFCLKLNETRPACPLVAKEFLCFNDFCLQYNDLKWHSLSFVSQSSCILSMILSLEYSPDMVTSEISQQFIFWKPSLSSERKALLSPLLTECPGPSSVMAAKKLDLWPASPTILLSSNIYIKFYKPYFCNE